MILADGRVVEDGSSQAVGAKVAAVIARLHSREPIFAEAIARFFEAPPAFGGLRVTVRNGTVAGVELTTTLAKA
jgi:hypothetical protein